VSKGYRAPHGRRPGASTSPGFRTGQGIEALAARSGTLGTPPPSGPEERKAALVICGHATGADDARMLLGMCGLLEVPGE
jgi:hypothetical protein